MLLYKSKGEETKCKNYRCIRMLSAVGKMYAGMLVERNCRVTEGLIYEQRSVKTKSLS